MRRVLTVAAALLLTAGCSSHHDSTTGAPSPGVPTPSPSVPSAPSGPAPAIPAPTTPAPPPPKLKAGMKGAAVITLQQRLTALGYWNGPADGTFGETTRQAVFALQKAAGIGRDGSVGPQTWKALDAGVRPRARSTSGYLVEISLTRQLLMFVDDGRVIAALNTSTGSNEHYRYQGESFRAETPTGHYTMGRQIDGMRHGPLGDLFRPKYFNGGIAVHGAPSIPPYPASHGCARVSDAAIDWIWSTGKIPLKTRIWVY